MHICEGFCLGDSLPKVQGGNPLLVKLVLIFKLLPCLLLFIYILEGYRGDDVPGKRAGTNLGKRHKSKQKLLVLLSQGPLRSH